MVESTAVRLLEDFSLEMTGKDVDALREAAPAIPAGTRINVTYLGNEDLPMRVAAAQAVRELGFTPVPHISARRIASEQSLREFLAALRDAGASQHVFVVGGDPAVPEGPYPDSLTIIRSGILQDYGVREVSIAGYPEGHPDIEEATLWEHLSAKTAALSDQDLGQVVLSQFAFDADRVTAWIAQVRAAGIDAEIRVGAPGPAGVKRLMGYARRFGVGASAGIVRKYGFSLTNLVGTAGPDRLITDLAADLAGAGEAAAVKAHFYTFGGLAATAEWVRDFVKEA
ncbi:MULTISPECIES: methylenetetrahydrofolate reductase [unclassified Brevibacterium]|uniref:methylenetetrahydrofolate reductase n=1 Tax=unclassified Brevibacterium TaxID=2614124 RepID=UPI0010F8453A|nr:MULTISPECIES: methylenetetrahydrofolate reductase [unclassified Brevibacterium]MCM1011369.1 methylenetetrahydrofolate reductase [Brevibacterium sp. XM4083]